MANSRGVVALDIGATKTLLTTRPADAAAAPWVVREVVDRRPTPADPGELVEWVVAALARRDPGREPAIIGIAAPGPLDHEAGVLTRTANLGWVDVAIGPLLADRLGIPFVLEDDAAAATLGEWTHGAGRDCDPFAYLTLSSGVGAGIVSDGRVLRGAGGNAGEIGHLVIAPDGPTCTCGNTADIEAFSGGDAIARRAVAELATASDDAPIDAARVFELAGGGDAVAGRIVDEAIDAMATALAVLTVSIAPERIAVGGAIGLGQQAVVQRAVDLAHGRVLAESAARMDVVAAELGDESVLAGAATIAWRALAR